MNWVEVLASRRGITVREFLVELIQLPDGTSRTIAAFIADGRQVRDSA